MVDVERSIDPKTVLQKLQKPQFYRLKIITMGNESVGKSCLIKRYCEERFVTKYVTTIGIDFGVKRTSIDGREVRVNFFDVAGSEDFLEIRNEFYKDSQAAILVFDVTNPKSFAALDGWLEESQKFGAKDMLVVVCGNKVDIGKRAVSEVDARKWAQGRGFGYVEVSANTGQNVVSMFEQLFRDTLTFKNITAS